MRHIMYLRPGNLEKDFTVQHKVTKKINGRMVDDYEEAADLLKGTITVATERQAEQTKNRWDQEQHSLSHTIVMHGSAMAKKEDRLICGERIFEVLAADDVGELGITTVYYTEERNDVR